MYGVLLVDDEPFALQGLQMMVDWAGHGFRVLGACEDGEEALRLIRRERPELVVTDIRMPSMDGIALIERAQAEGFRDIKFVVSSGYSDFDYARRALHLGAAYYLSKPIVEAEAAEMLARLRRELDERARARLVRSAGGRYALRNALSRLLRGADPAADRDMQAALDGLAAEAPVWACLRIATDAAGAERARAAAERFAARHGRCYAADLDRRSFGLACGFAARDEARLRAFAARLSRELEHAASGRIGIAIGGMESGPGALARSAAGARAAQPFLFYGDGGERPGVVYYDDVKGKAFAFDAGLLRAADELADCLDTGGARRMEERLASAFRMFRAELMQPQLVCLFALHALLRCADICREMGGDPDRLLAEAGWPRLDLRAMRVGELESFLAGYCRACRGAIAELRELRAGGVPARVAGHLRRHYREPSTIRELAERFYVSPVYLGRAFARKFGVGISDYVHDLRIAEARRLLRGTDLSAAAIAESLGYGSYQHFLRQFEKRVGAKPAQYKRQAGRP